MSEHSYDDLCPRCKQVPMREGVYLSVRKAEIFDVIKQHPKGITIEGIIANLSGGDVSSNTMRQHIHQINRMLESTDVQIISDGAGSERRRYRIDQRSGREAA